MLHPVVMVSLELEMFLLTINPERLAAFETIVLSISPSLMNSFNELEETGELSLARVFFHG